jgi:hypothetical protein
MPVFGESRCTVPGCDRVTQLEGQRQGFQVAAAKSHALAHWFKWHVAQGHTTNDVADCPDCKKAGYSYYSASKRTYFV